MYCCLLSWHIEKCTRLTLKSLISSCCFNFSKKDWKKSLLSTWRGATHKASISAPAIKSYISVNSCCSVGYVFDDSNLIRKLNKVSAIKVNSQQWQKLWHKAQVEHCEAQTMIHPEAALDSVWNVKSSVLSVHNHNNNTIYCRSAHPMWWIPPLLLTLRVLLFFLH